MAPTFWSPGQARSDETVGGVLNVAGQGEFDELCAALLAKLVQLDDDSSRPGTEGAGGLAFEDVVAVAGNDMERFWVSDPSYGGKAVLEECWPIDVVALRTVKTKSLVISASAASRSWVR